MGAERSRENPPSLPAGAAGHSPLRTLEAVPSAIHEKPCLCRGNLCEGRRLGLAVGLSGAPSGGRLPVGCTPRHRRKRWREFVTPRSPQLWDTGKL